MERKARKMNNNNKQKDNSGALFVNDRKEKDTQPDYTGKCMVNGRMMQISSWKNTSSKGNTYLGLSFSEPYEADASNNKPKDEMSFPE